MAVRQLGYVPILSIRGWDEEGRPLLLQGESGSGLPTDVEVVFPSSDARPVLYLEERDSFLVLAFEPGGRAVKPALRLALTATTGAQEVLVGILHESGAVRSDGMRLQVEMDFRPLLQADFLPGVGLIVGGSSLALIAVALLWLIQPGLVWAAAAPIPPSGTRIRLTLIVAPGEGRGGGARVAGSSARAGRILHGASRAAFLVLGGGATAAAALAWRATGSLVGHPVGAGWLLAGVFLAAMSLLAWHAPRRSLYWAACLAVSSAVAVAAGLIR